MTYTLVATAKNEAPYLLEWVAYHRMIGFDEILIYQNDSDDFTHEILTEMARIGAVRYSYNRALPGRHQIRAYRRAGRQPAYLEADWALALDLDEFLHVNCGAGRLDDLMAALPEADVVLLNWRYFGSGGHLDLTDDLVTERFVLSEHDTRIVEELTPYKAMFRPPLFERCGIHRPAKPKRPEEEMIVCNGSGLTGDAFERLRFRSKDPWRRRLAQVNHYITRDAASFVLKSDRGSAHQAHREIDRRYWRRRNFNVHEDRRLAERSDEIVAAMAELDLASGGKLRALREAALAAHRQRFEQLLGQSAFRDLFAFCREFRPAA